MAFNFELVTCGAAQRWSTESPHLARAQQILFRGSARKKKKKKPLPAAGIAFWD